MFCFEDQMHALQYLPNIFYQPYMAAFRLEAPRWIGKNSNSQTFVKFSMLVFVFINLVAFTTTRNGLLTTSSSLGQVWPARRKLPSPNTRVIWKYFNTMLIESDGFFSGYLWWLEACEYMSNLQVVLVCVLVSMIFTHTNVKIQRPHVQNTLIYPKSEHLPSLCV